METKPLIIWQMLGDDNFTIEFQKNCKYTQEIIRVYRATPALEPMVVYHIMKLKSEGYFQNINTLQFHEIFITMILICFKFLEDGYPEPKEFCRICFNPQIKIQEYEIWILKALNFCLKYQMIWDGDKVGRNHYNKVKGQSPYVSKQYYHTADEEA